MKMDERSKACAEVVEQILVSNAYMATKYVSDKLTVKATRRRYKGKPQKGANVDMVLTIGKPNYEQRKKFKQAKKENRWPIEMMVKYPQKKK
jgi:serine protease inhibitor